MKTKITALALVAVTALSLAPKPASAGDKEWAIAGGIIGGIIIGSAISDSRDHRTVIVRDNDCDDRNGYWKETRVRVWVPGCWVVERRHNHSYKRYVSGHYTFRTDRIWVSYDRHDRRNRHDRHDHNDRHDRHDRDDRDDRRGR